MALLIYDNLPISHKIGRIELSHVGLSEVQKSGKDRQLFKPIDFSKDKPNRPPSKSTASTNQYLETQKQLDTLDERRKLQAFHIMTTPVITAKLTDSLSHAWNTLQTEEIDHLVVVNEMQQPLNLITSLQLLKVGITSENSLATLSQRQVIAITSDTLVRDIADYLIQTKATAMPVVDDQHQLIGIVCRSDLLNLLVAGHNLSLCI